MGSVGSDGLMYLKPSGRVGIKTNNPNYTFDVVGDAAKTTGTAWINTSDSRTKKNITPFTRGLDAILEIDPVYF